MNMISRYGYGHISKWLSVIFSTMIILMLGSQCCCAEDVTLQWDPCPSDKVVGYKVHIIAIKTADHSVVDAGNVTSCVVRGLSKHDDYKFSVTAYDAAGFESEDSNGVYWRSQQTGIQAEDAVVLRQFCNRYVATNRIGQFIIKEYRWISPTLADLYQSSETFRLMTKWILAPLVFILQHPLRSVAMVTVTTCAGIGIMFYRRRKRKALP
jgi:hypothetical protein